MRFAGHASISMAGKGRVMDSIRGMFGVGIAQLMVLSVMVPSYADVNDDDEEHSRLRGRRHSQTISRCREDYPVIANWLTSPETQNDATK